MHLLTERLTLMAAAPAHLMAELSRLTERPIDDDHSALGKLLGARVPKSWPPELFEIDDIERSLATALATPNDPGWGMWYLVEADQLVGIAGYDGPPAQSRVMLGYSVLPSARGRGLATEAARALVAWAFRHPSVEVIAAETFPELTPSLRVLEKLGFAPVATARTPGALAFECRRQDMVRAVGLEPT